MVIKENFVLLKNVPNILNLSRADIINYSIDRGPRKVFVVLELNKSKINHFTKDRVYSLISDLEKRKTVQVVNLPSYNLHASFNQKTKQIILNISPFNTDDIYSTEPDPKNLYTQLVYGILFDRLINQKVSIKTSFYIPISEFFLSLFMGLFGKEYGLLGTYSNRISKLNFLINCYVLQSFFGIDIKKSYSMASTSSGFNYKEIESELSSFDFSNIESFIKALSYFNVMSGIDKYSFTRKVYSLVGIHFLPALEDFSRFICIMTCASMKGSNLIPTFLPKYNEKAFAKIIEISKIAFKK